MGLSTSEEEGRRLHSLQVLASNDGLWDKAHGLDRISWTRFEWVELLVVRANFSESGIIVLFGCFFTSGTDHGFGHFVEPYRSHMSNSRPAGQMWPAVSFYIAYESFFMMLSFTQNSKICVKVNDCVLISSVISRT